MVLSLERGKVEPEVTRFCASQGRDELVVEWRRRCWLGGAGALSGRCAWCLVAVFFPVGDEFVHHWAGHFVGGFQ
jgi:hypothetical protein